MKRWLQFLALYFILCFSAYAQNFIQVTKNNANQLVNLTENEVLEVKLPAVPSTGYSWYLRSERVSVVEQAGDWTFETDDKENPIGAPGIQTIRFIGKSQGMNELEFLYRRPWEEESLATDSYKIKIASEGVYTGKALVQEPEPLLTQLIDASQTENRALPESFSWLDKGKCTPVKNQGSCGSCWAFASCGSFESVIKIFDNVTRDLSEQWMVNCDKKASGCSGGWCPNYMLKTYGSVYEADLKYTQQNGTCKPSYTYHEKIAGSTEIATTPTVAQIKQAIYDYGPVWACVKVGTNFNSYKSGVLTKTDGNQVNHAIVLVGWDDRTSSWVLRNSWGTGWGEKGGYMRIAYGISAIGYRSAYIDYKGKISHVVTGTVSSHHAAAIRVFPNPTSGKFLIEGVEKESNVEVYDAFGKLISKAAFQNNSISVDLSSQSKGMYFYRVLNAGTEAVKQGKVLVH